MKHEIKISKLAIACVICATTASGAFGAASVRSLGGAGTYSGTSSAASASGQTTGSVNAVRAGSMRVAAPAGGDAAVSASVAAPRAATSQRLSIGKYLGGGTSVSGGSSIKNQKPGVTGGGSSIDPEFAADFEKRVTGLENRLDDVLSKVDDVNSSLDGKQNFLVGDQYITVNEDKDQREIYLNIDRLQEDIKGQAGADGKDGRDVDIVTDDTGIWWQYSGEPATKKLLAEWENLRGATGEQGAPGVVDEETLNQAITNAIAKIDYVTTDQFNELNDITNTIVNSLNNYYTKTEVEQKIIETGITDVDFTEYAKTATVNAELSKKADADSLKALAYKDQVADADVASDAAIAKTKLANDVQTSLSRADRALTADGVSTDGDWVLAISDGQQNWFEVVTE